VSGQIIKQQLMISVTFTNRDDRLLDCSFDNSIRRSVQAGTKIGTDD
jgi:hypothetical protein